MRRSLLVSLTIDRTHSMVWQMVVERAVETLRQLSRQCFSTTFSGNEDRFTEGSSEQKRLVFIEELYRCMVFVRFFLWFLYRN